MSVQKPETADRSRRGAAYPMEVLTLDAGRTTYLSAEEAARLALDRAPRLEAHPQTPVGTPKGPDAKPPATPVGTPKSTQGTPPTPVGTPKSAKGYLAAALTSPKSAQGTPLRTPRRGTREGIGR